MQEKEAKQIVNLKSMDDLGEAYTWLFNQQRNAKIDAKTAEAMNKTLSGVTYLRGTLRVKVAQLLFQAAVKKVAIAPNLLPVLE